MHTVNLNYGWKYNPAFEEKFLSAVYEDKAWSTVEIPHANKEIPYNNFDEETYQFVSCYRKNFFAEEEWKGKKLILEFEAVANAAEVFINGKFAFAHNGAYTAFRADIAEYVNYGKENVIAVKVDSTERPDIPPFGGVVDYLCYGGIYREVYLYVHEPIYVASLLCAPKDVLTAPKIAVKIDLNVAAKCDADITVAYNGQTVASAKLSFDNSITENLTLKVPDAKLWSLENPNLYTVTATLAGGEESLSARIGIRECRFRKNGFYLNGKHVKIIGLNRHQSYPYVGYAMPRSVQEADADLLKFRLGCNLVRTSHYPNSKHFLNRCDEIGLLVFTEIPGWQHIAQYPDAKKRAAALRKNPNAKLPIDPIIDAWRKKTVDHVREMILEDYNHPSIILWGVRINESGDDNSLYKETNALARGLDASRQTGGVRCIPQSHLLEDVYTFNDFLSNGTKRALWPRWFVTGRVPYLVTEHNGHMFPTKTFDHEKKRQEHALRHARVLNRMMSDDSRCGAIGWCMSDYNTHKDFGSGDKICYHGVTDMFRVPKLAAYSYAIQQKYTPVLEISSNMEIGDNAGGKVGTVYMFTNCDSVKMHKNGILINTFDVAKEYENCKEFKSLKFKPLPLDDIIGDQLAKDEEYKMSPRDAESMKRALLAIKKFGTVGGIVRHPLAILKSLLKYRLSVASITHMFGKFVTGWGGKQVTYKFEGYIGGKLVVVCEKGAVNAVHLYAAADKSSLEEAATYDAVRIELKAMNQCNSVMPYDNGIVNISTNGIVDVIGPEQISLIGGQRAVWVKTNGKSGKAVVTLTSPTLGEQKIELNVIDRKN